MALLLALLTCSTNPAGGPGRGGGVGAGAGDDCGGVDGGEGGAAFSFLCALSFFFFFKSPKNAMVIVLSVSSHPW